MLNKKLADIFYEIADFLEIENIPFKPYAYRRASESLKNLSEEVEIIYKKEGRAGLDNIPGVGESIADKIIEYIETGRIKSYQEYKKKYPFEMREIISVEGLGPRKIKDLYQKLKIKNLKDLKKSAQEGKIRGLPNFGVKTEKNILEGIKFLNKSKGRFLLGKILPQIEQIEKKLKGLKEVKRINVCGSIRRRKETIGDADFLVVTDKPNPVMDFFCSLPEVVKVWGKGETKSSVRVEQGFNVDLRVVPEGSYGSALQYFTGSKEHNIQLRIIASEKGLKLNEYGLFKNKKRIAGGNEKDIYESLGMDYIPPEIRENEGEIEVALHSFGRLPKLVELKDIKGDLHCHSDWNGGENSILEMAQTAINKGYEYLGISDHTKFLKIENGLDEKQLAQQRKEIERLNVKLKIQNSKFRVLQGCELNILNDGRVDIKDEALGKLEYAIAGVHSNFKMPEKEMTERMIRAMKNPYIKIISHPTGRILKRREGYQIDLEKVFRAAKETKTILEINAQPERLDLNDINIKRALKSGVRLIIDSDAHQKEDLSYIKYGLYQSRRGWAEKRNIVNTFPLKKLLELFKEKS